jgi:hypothetical protein
VDRLTPATATRTVIDIADLTPTALATLKHVASMPNPVFYDRQRRRFSTSRIPRFLRSYDETLADALVLPRGLAEITVTIVTETGSKLEVDDERAIGEPQQLAFTTRLRDDQAAAVGGLVDHELGVLVAPPGWGRP